MHNVCSSSPHHQHHRHHRREQNFSALFAFPLLISHHSSRKVFFFTKKLTITSTLITQRHPSNALCEPKKNESLVSNFFNLFKFTLLLHLPCDSNGILKNAAQIPRVSDAASNSQLLNVQQRPCRVKVN